jgi:nitrogen-specific signal transduction histidine kinase
MSASNIALMAMELHERQSRSRSALHIASEIAAAHGGTLSVQSSDEETRFIFLMK